MRNFNSSCLVVGRTVERDSPNPGRRARDDARARRACAAGAFSHRNATDGGRSANNLRLSAAVELSVCHVAHFAATLFRAASVRLRDRNTGPRRDFAAVDLYSARDDAADNHAANDNAATIHASIPEHDRSSRVSVREPNHRATRVILCYAGSVAGAGHRQPAAAV